MQVNTLSCSCLLLSCDCTWALTGHPDKLEPRQVDAAIRPRGAACCRLQRVEEQNMAAGWYYIAILPCAQQ